jgi:aromatic-L-amino-acid/L-tryptophan decarboxylase
MSPQAPPQEAGRISALEMHPDEFRRIGHDLVEKIAGLLETVCERPVTPGETPAQVRAALGHQRTLPEQGEPAAAIVNEAWRLLSQHSLFNGHPRFAGYVTSSPATIGILADLIAAAINPNCGAWILSPMGSEIEAQAVRWIAEFIGYPAGCGGLLVSGGNMANIVGFWAARRARAGWDIRARGVSAGPALTAYASRETHTWIHKAADLSGLGTDAIRWIGVTEDGRIDTRELVHTVEADLAEGKRPFLLCGSAGTVGTGAVDPLDEMAEIAARYGLWLHVDGAYGAPAAALSDASPDLRAMARADSVALDPHKWLYAPLEAGCTLVRDAQLLRDAFDYSPAYYRFNADAEEHPLNYYQHGPQNSRGFRALKVWMGLRTAGREGLCRMIGDDVRLARALYQELERYQPELERFTHGLSITTFRYVPAGFDKEAPGASAYLDELNTLLLDRIQKCGEVFLSNAVVSGKYALRACIVNFRTTMQDIRIIPEVILRLGRACHEELLQARTGNQGTSAP